MRKRKFGISDIIVIAIIVGIIVGIVLFFTRSNNKTETITATEFYERLEANNIKEISFYGEKGDQNRNILTVEGLYTDEYIGSSKIKGFIVSLNNEDYNKIMTIISNESIKTKNNGMQVISSFDWFNLIYMLFMIAVPIVLIIIIMRSSGGGADKAFTFGKSRATLNKKSSVTFKDVAGLDEERQEMMEIVDFLKNPQKYFQMGARIPKGILLVGSPGTGKTLIAKAVAGEANVPFYSISGSDFVEMFVGVGASRVRDMFKNAKQNSPCIIFIDEIDAVGRQRGAGLGGGHDEREQTLNQLLVEMDGFSTNSGVIVLAATNRADILDPALLRPGRFDRQIVVPLPDMKAREQILNVHARGKHISPKVNMADIARRTPGFSGADLENLLNEAALLAARENAKEIKIYHIDEAVDRVMMGPAKKSRKYSEKEKAVVAYHEAGHAVIGIRLKHAQKVQKVTIIPRGEAGGYNLMTPEEETFLQTKESLEANIIGLLGGRIAEELIFKQMTTGAQNDFQKATRIARAMVTEFGMSSLGPIEYETNTGSVFLGRDYMKEKNFSDQVALEIDNEVRRIINECYEIGKQTLIENKSLLDLIAKHLVEIETLNKEDIEELVNTGQLGWWEKKKAKLNEQNKVEAPTEEKPVENKQENN